MTRMDWCEAIIRTAARQIVISSKINTWKYFITWFAGKGMRYDPGSYVGDYRIFVSKASLRRIHETDV